MIESNKYLDEITLECLMNKEQFAKYLNKNTQSFKLNEKDKRFYKRRIFDLTKRLLNNEKPERIFPDVKGAFDEYSKICIEYFKVIDKVDIIQGDYDNLDMDEVKSIDTSNLKTVEDANQIIMRSIKMREPNSLEKLVKRKVTKKPKPVLLPQQKAINLKDPLLKNKGVAKKKNIDTIYEEQKNI
jgi:hypothetical protein